MTTKQQYRKAYAAVRKFNNSVRNNSVYAPIDRAGFDNAIAAIPAHIETAARVSARNAQQVFSTFQAHKVCRINPDALIFAFYNRAS